MHPQEYAAVHAASQAQTIDDEVTVDERADPRLVG